MSIKSLDIMYFIRNNKIMKTIQDRIEKVKDFFPGAFIYREEELILDKKLNVYFRLPDIETVEEFDYKLLSYCSYYTANNHFKPTSKTSKYFRERINRYFKTNFTIEELQTIYTYLGVGANRPIGVKFIKSGLDLNNLKKNIEKRDSKRKEK